jgi:hypothetical protein
LPFSTGVIAWIIPHMWKPTRYARLRLHGILHNKAIWNCFGEYISPQCGLVVYCPKLENIKDVFSLFSNVKIGIEEFNYVSLDENNIHSFWLVTAIK